MKFYSEIKGLLVHRRKAQSLQFVDGVYETEDPAEIEVLERVPEVVKKGQVAAEKADAVKKLPPVEQAPLELDEMSYKQLKEYAAAEEIKIPAKIKSQKDILAFLQEYILKAATADKD